MENNLKTQGFLLLDVDVVALNNAGKDTTSNFDNAIKTKSVYNNTSLIFAPSFKQRPPIEPASLLR